LQVLVQQAIGRIVVARHGEEGQREAGHQLLPGQPLALPPTGHDISQVDEKTAVIVLRAIQHAAVDVIAVAAVATDGEAELLTQI
jgi:hypothetical protein